MEKNKQTKILISRFQNLNFVNFSFVKFKNGIKPQEKIVNC